jgi:hypothetical protein
MAQNTLLVLSEWAPPAAGSSTDDYFTIKVCHACFVKILVGELVDKFANVGELLADILQLAAEDGQAVPDPERADECSILLNGEVELITANKVFEARLLDRIRRSGGRPADLLPPKAFDGDRLSTRSSARQGALVAAPHWHGDDRSVKIFSPVNHKFVPPLKAGQDAVKVKGTEVTLGFYHEKSVLMFEVEMAREGMGVVEWTRIQPQPPEIGLDAPTRLTVTGLEPETRYRFRVRACMETAKSPWTKTALPVLTDKHIEKESPSPKRKAKVASPHTARARKRAAAAPAPAAGPSTAGPSDGGLQSVKAMLQAAGLSYAALEEVSQKLHDNGFSHLETLKALEANGNLKDIMREIGIKLGHYCQMALALK